MARRATKKEEIPLLTALRFIGPTQKEGGNPSETHCRIANGYVVGFNGILSAGYPHSGADGFYPNTQKLITALSRVKETYALTMLPDNQLAVKTDKFRALIPCADPWLLEPVEPDQQLAELDDDFRLALNAAGLLATDGASTVLEASVMVRNGSCVGTNRLAIIEYWHGVNLPVMILPKSFVALLDKVTAKIVGFGCSNTTFTLWFDNGAWLKTQLYMEDWPNIDNILKLTENAAPSDIPTDFFEAIKSVKDFSENNQIHIRGGFAYSHQHENVGASFSIGEMRGDIAGSVKSLLVFENLATKYDFTTSTNVGIFFGKNMRGCVSKAR